MITTNFTNNVLEVYKDDRLIIIQPFKPTSTGEQTNWIDEQDALSWWENEKHRYDYEIPEVEPPPVASPNNEPITPPAN
jgi:hypothetical protein